MKGFWQWNSVASAGCVIYIAERITLDTALGQKNGHGDRVVVWHISYGSLDNKLLNYEILHSISIHSVVKRSPGAVPRTEMDLSMFGKNFTLELKPSRGLFSKRFKIIVVSQDNSEKIVSGYDQSHFYTGHVKGETNSQAAIHVDEDNVATGVFTSEEEEYFIEPVHRHVDESDANYRSSSAMVAYRRSDIKTDGSEGGLCGSVHPNTSSGFDEVVFDTFNPDSDAHDRYKRATNDLTSCPVIAVADYKFYQHMGQSNNFTTANYIANIFNRVNGIYRSTNFGMGTGYGVEIDTMVIHNAPTTSGSKYQYNIEKTNWGTMQLLEAFGRSDQYSDYCLAHLFTSQAMPDSILGLAYIASPSRGTLGGICSPTQTVDGDVSAYNIGWTSAKNGAGNTLTFTQSSLVTAHGHNWGSEHDPSSWECAPIFGDGKYLMYAYSVTGEDSNNNVFSSCSRSSINNVLGSKAADCFQVPAVESLCGNGRIDAGEECDGGFLGRIGQDNKCCTRDCMLTDNAACSPANFPCCNSECQVASPGVNCSTDIEGSCKQASQCDGLGFECPEGANKGEGTPCIDGGSCRLGVCESFCEYRGYNSCVCETVDSSCKRCCRNLATGVCSEYQPVINVADGRSCVQGYCENGNCIKVETDLVARLWTLVDKISVDFIIESFKTNMVGCVTGFSLVLYIPICIAIWCYDRSRKKKWERENSITVRKDRTLAHDEDKRPVENKERSISSQKPVLSDTDDYMVPLPRRPGSSSKNQIQPLGHKPSSSRA